MMNNTITEQLTYRIVNEVLNEQFLLEAPGPPDGPGGGGKSTPWMPDVHPSGGGWWKHEEGWFFWVDENGNVVDNPRFNVKPQPLMPPGGWGGVGRPPGQPVGKHPHKVPNPNRPGSPTNPVGTSPIGPRQFPNNLEGEGPFQKRPDNWNDWDPNHGRPGLGPGGGRQPPRGVVPIKGLGILGLLGTGLGMLLSDPGPGRGSNEGIPTADPMEGIPHPTRYQNRR